jgi:TPR repeat protein
LKDLYEILGFSPKSETEVFTAAYIAFCSIIVFGLFALLMPASKTGQPTSSDAVATEPAPEGVKCRDDVDKKDWQSVWQNCFVAAQQGDVRSQVRLGFMYDDGQVVAEDNVEAVKWYRKAADQGDEDAKKRLTELQTAGGQSVVSDDTRPIEVLPSDERTADLAAKNFAEARQIAQAGYTNAKVSHLVGPGIPRGAPYSGFIIHIDPKSQDALIVKGDFASALPMYLQSYEGNGDPDAAHNLGLMYARGLGVAPNREKARKYLVFSQANRRWDADSWEIAKISK